MSSTESKQFSNVSATTAQFSLLGGKYSFDALATWGSGNVQVQLLGGDFTSWLNCGSAISSNGVQVLDLAIGSYRIAVASGASAVYTRLTKIVEG